MNTDWFTLTKGLRQGDVLSPYLLMEVFIRSVKAAAEELRIAGFMPIQRGIKLNQLAFVNDYLLVVKAEPQEVVSMGCYSGKLLFGIG